VIGSIKVHAQVHVSTKPKVCLTAQYNCQAGDIGCRLLDLD
jgi:hypothetical protein